MSALCSACVYWSGGGGGGRLCGTSLTIMMTKPMKTPRPRTVPTVHMKTLRSTTRQPRSTYRFFFLPAWSPGPARSQLCCVSSSCRISAARSRSRLRSSSVAESALEISSGPPQGSRPNILPGRLAPLSRSSSSSARRDAAGLSPLPWLGGGGGNARSWRVEGDGTSARHE
jgi:hypothetical protein